MSARHARRQGDVPARRPGDVRAGGRHARTLSWAYGPVGDDHGMVAVPLDDGDGVARLLLTPRQAIKLALRMAETARDIVEAAHRRNILEEVNR